MACRRRDLNLIFSLQFEHRVNRDNTVSFQNLSLQIERVRLRATLGGCQVVVHQHLNGNLSLTHGPHCLGRYTAQGTAVATAEMPARRAVEKTRAGHKADFPTSLGNPANPAGFPLSHSPNGCWFTLEPDISCATKTGHFNLLRTEARTSSAFDGTASEHVRGAQRKFHRRTQSKFYTPRSIQHLRVFRRHQRRLPKTVFT